MESLTEAYSGKRVFVTGHTGFKGSWLCTWLLDLGAVVTGYSLPPPTKPALFTQLGLASRVNHLVGDVRDAEGLASAVTAARPDYLFHLAAQPIVQSAHRNPSETWATNVMGTVNVLDALRGVRGPCGVVVVTTDKVYGRQSRVCAEYHALGGAEPYGASKAAAELAVEAWRETYFSARAAQPGKFPRVAIATARAGNAIGGGDWATDRLVPDMVRALQKGKPAFIRNPGATRPWQHVLDPLAGYLMLASRLRMALSQRRAAALRRLSGPFNFGPTARNHRTVREVAQEIARLWPGSWTHASRASAHAEAMELRLDAAKAGIVLGWRPKWEFSEAVGKTVEWYRTARSGREAERATARHLAEHQG